MKRTVIAALVLVMLLSLCACGAEPAGSTPTAAPAPATETPTPETGTPESAAPEWSELSFDRTMPLEYATHFKVDYAGEDYKRISVLDDRTYLVVAEGAPVPEGMPENIVVLQQPLDQIYLVASAAMDSFAQLDAIENITLSGRKESAWYIEKAQTAMQNGDMVYAGKYSEPDYELILSEGCDMALENTMIYHSPAVMEQLERLGIPVFVETSSHEEMPFGRMEWVKAYAALLNIEDKAEELFNAKMDSVSGVLDQEPTDKTVGFFYVTSSGAVNVRRSSDYIAKAISMAGGQYISFDDVKDADVAESTVNIQMEAFYNGAIDADVLIYNGIVDGEIETIDELTAIDPLRADFKAVREGNVWCLKKSFYQESLELSDLILDVNAAVNGADGEGLRFLTRLK